MARTALEIVVKSIFVCDLRSLGPIGGPPVSLRLLDRTCVPNQRAVRISTTSDDHVRACLRDESSNTDGSGGFDGIGGGPNTHSRRPGKKGCSSE